MKRLLVLLALGALFTTEVDAHLTLPTTRVSTTPTANTDVRHGISSTGLHSAGTSVL